MNEWIAFLLPLAVALVGARLNGLLLGKVFNARFGDGVKFALGLAVGMLVFSQAVFFAAFIGINAAGALAWLALIWGGVELLLALAKIFPNLHRFKPRTPHLWLLLLLPVVYSWWIFARLSTLEGTLEFDAAAFWVFKSKIIYLTQGQALAASFHNPNLAYMHWHYPTLVSCLYTLGYGAVGGVDEFINKVWPFWMLVALSLAILSLGKVWQSPRPLPIVTVVLVCFLPASLQFLRQEGGTVPLLFYTSLACLMIVQALYFSEKITLAAGVLVLAGCAATKLEGVVFAGVWFVILLPVIWKRGWLNSSLLWKAAGAGVICLVPYGMLRLAQPVADPANGWFHEVVTSPGLMFLRFWETCYLNLGGRFFSQGFFHFSTNDAGAIAWAGKWTGLDSFFNQELAVLPWLMIFLLVGLLWKGSHQSRRVLGYLSLAIIGGCMFLALVITSYLSHLNSDARDFNIQLIEFSSNVVGRYYYPLFTAWFLGMMSIIFASQSAPASNNHTKLEGGNGKAGRA